METRRLLPQAVRARAVWSTASRNSINTASSRIFSTTLQTHGLPAATPSHVIKADFHYSCRSIHATRRLGTLGGFRWAYVNPMLSDRGIVAMGIFSASFSTGSVIGMSSIYQREWKIPRAKLTPIRRHRRVVLLDENGKNLGEMESKIAQGLAEGHGLTVVEVKDTDKTEKYPVFKMISKRELSEDEKTKRVLVKQKKKLEMYKEFKLGTRISDHDMEIKIRNIRNILVKGVMVRVSVEAKRRKGMSAEVFQAELERRSVVLGDITKKLRDIATMSNRKLNKVKKGDVMSEYKPLPPAEGLEAVSQNGAELVPQKGVESAEPVVESGPEAERRVESSGSESHGVELTPEEGAESPGEETSPQEGVESGEEFSPKGVPLRDAWKEGT